MISMPEGGSSTIDVAKVLPDRRLAAWADALNEYYYALDVDNAASGFGAGRLTAIDIGDIRLGRTESDPMIIRRRRGHIGQSDGDYYLVQMPLHCSLTLEQQARRAEIMPGDLTVVGTNECYTLEQGARGTVLTLRIPGPVLRDRLVDMDDLTARRYAAERPALTLFTDFARSLWLNGNRLDDFESQAATKTLIEILGLALSTHGRDQAQLVSSTRLAHRQRALRLIDARLGDAQLSPSYIAKTLKLSERYLQKIFAERRSSLSELIRARRIAEAKRLLDRTSAAKLPISSVAYLVGFRDPSYFSRVFVAETGMSPSEFRNRR
jgi:AraC-like DNA-binding protein